MRYSVRQRSFYLWYIQEGFQFTDASAAVNMTVLLSAESSLNPITLVKEVIVWIAVVISTAVSAAIVVILIWICSVLLRFLFCGCGFFGGFFAIFLIITLFAKSYLYGLFLIGTILVCSLQSDLYFRTSLLC